MKTAIVNIKTIVTGDWRTPFADGDAILMEKGKIRKVGTLSSKELKGCDVVVDANKTTACPGLIDSQVHIAFGDYTPRQKTVGFIESYLHGGVTSCLSASEVHVPGRPTDPEGVKALAVAAKKSFDNLRPGGARVYGGCIILEPGLTQKDFNEVAKKGIWFAKAGFGAVKTPFDYTPLVKMAQKAGMLVNCHTGGASIPGSSPIIGKHLMDMRPDVSFHINGGPIAMPDKDFPMIINETDIALQICQAGNIRTALLCLNLAVENEKFDRFLIATDTPTGTGVMPLGMIKSVTEMATLSSYPAEWMIAAATGSVAKIYRLNSGFIKRGKDADVLLIDAPLGGSKKTALEAIKHGDLAAVGAVFTDGIPRFIGRSRNTPPTTRQIKTVQNNVPYDFSGKAH
ncbi:MAG: amidohydrolase [Rhodospirillaceae bacterium]|nr:amidohydrolase [Rhodospirillaceae bacterium]|tara:strand:+ start:2341 stop:3537 length:1197 start_codon:yes stop_codon:yes gene_type:complete